MFLDRVTQNGKALDIFAVANAHGAVGIDQFNVVAAAQISGIVISHTNRFTGVENTKHQPADNCWLVFCVSLSGRFFTMLNPTQKQGDKQEDDSTRSVAEGA